MFCLQLMKIVGKGQQPMKMMFCQPFSSVQPVNNHFIVRKNRFVVKKNEGISLASACWPKDTRVVLAVGFHTSWSRKSPIWKIILDTIRTLDFGRMLNQEQRLLAKPYVAAGVILTVIGSYLFYATHLKECPITKRKKFVILSEKQITNIAKQASKSQRKQYGRKVTKSGTVYKHVTGISDRILGANRHLPGMKKDWSVFIIEDKRVRNAFVLPNGDIFVFTGIVDAVSNEDQLAAVMGHEIAHALLNHAGEQISKTFLLELLLLLPVVLIWMMIPDIADVSRYVTEYIGEILFKLPMSRQLETEADLVGLEMMARACYDPREAVQFWKVMAKLSQGQPIEWLSTHPSHKTRYDTLARHMPEAMVIYTRHCKT